MSNTIRNHEVDVIRMAALIGICIVNIPFMALPVEAVFASPGPWYDKAAAFLVESLLQLKFFILFSFIFGWGMAIQARSAAAKGADFTRRYFRRLVGLALFGVAHAIFVFSGDILLTYALLGGLLWLVKDKPPGALLKIGVGMIFLSVISLGILASMISIMLAEGGISSPPSAASLGGGFLEATQARLAEWPITLIFLFFLQGPLAFAAFAAGLAAAKTDFFAKDSAGFLRLQQKLPLLLSIALPLNLLYAATVGGMVPEFYPALNFLGFVLIAFGAPALSAVYLYLFIQLARNLKMPGILIHAGRNSLSTYILQGVLAGFVFGAYGLGYFDTLTHAALIPIALLIAFATMAGVGIYAKIFGKGPLEPILRWISGR